MPGNGGLSLLPLAERDLAAIVELHREGLSYSINSQLGRAHLAHLYRVLRRDRACLVACASLNGRLAGVVSAALDPEAMAGRLVASLGAGQWASLAGRLLLNPGLLLAWLESRRVNQPVIFKGAEVRPCLTAIVVAEACRRAGVGRVLVGAVDDFFRGRGCAAYRLDTRRDNEASRAFYRRLGFVEVEQRGPAVVLVRELAHDSPPG